MSRSVLSNERRQKISLKFWHPNRRFFPARAAAIRYKLILRSPGKWHTVKPPRPKWLPSLAGFRCCQAEALSSFLEIGAFSRDWFCILFMLGLVPLIDAKFMRCKWDCTWSFEPDFGTHPVTANAGLDALLSLPSCFVANKLYTFVILYNLMRFSVCAVLGRLVFFPVKISLFHQNLSILSTFRTHVTNVIHSSLYSTVWLFNYIRVIFSTLRCHLLNILYLPK